MIEYRYVVTVNIESLGTFYVNNDIPNLTKYLHLAKLYKTRSCTEFVISECKRIYKADAGLNLAAFPLNIHGTIDRHAPTRKYAIELLLGVREWWYLSGTVYTPEFKTFEIPTPYLREALTFETEIEAKVFLQDLTKTHYKTYRIVPVKLP